MNQCSRPTPEKYSGTWTPSEKDIADMEANFSKISILKVKSCCVKGAQIKDPEDYYRQYVGIVVEGRKLIYINAFPRSHAKEDDRWKTSAPFVCDGGPAFWGVLYDPETKEFFDLAVNGVA